MPSMVVLVGDGGYGAGGGDTLVALGSDAGNGNVFIICPPLRITWGYIAWHLSIRVFVPIGWYVDCVINSSYNHQWIKLELFRFVPYILEMYI